ncbi:hypothetical protein [Acinetobacter sp. NyZ410]|uniref:hypothetical protein n=1 Tax=Acinetobacter sp. NyZ410 TaxID=2929509 RepID=UPI001FBB436C|nr:hypothetical protein [Acinetobacter sp. NyZ410]UOH19874.1 hypothetical protein MTO68_06925 [Acinetobacter sp. NyZ410]
MDKFEEAICGHNPLYKEGLQDKYYQGAKWAWQSRQTEVDQLREELAKLKDRLELAHHLATQSTWSSLKQLRKVVKALRGEHEA